MNTEYDVWLGLDVGKTNHHGCGLNPAGERISTTLVSMHSHRPCVLLRHRPYFISFVVSLQMLNDTQ